MGRLVSIERTARLRQQYGPGNSMEAFAKVRRVLQKLPLRCVRFVYFYANGIKIDETTKPISKVNRLLKLAQMPDIFPYFFEQILEFPWKGR